MPALLVRKPPLESYQPKTGYYFKVKLGYNAVLLKLPEPASTPPQRHKQRCLEHVQLLSK